MNLPNTFIEHHSLVFEQGSNGGLYLATEVGIYFTNNRRILAYEDWMSANPVPESADDMGNTSGWIRLGDGFPHVVSRGLEINYNVNRIRVGTRGRGVWEHSLHCPEGLFYEEITTYSSDAYLEAREYINSTASVGESLKVTYRGGTQVRLLPGFHASSGSRFHGFIHPCNEPGNSFTYKDLLIDQFDQEDESPTSLASFEVFPNPSAGKIWIRYYGPTHNPLAKVRIYNLLGKEVAVFTVTQHVTEWDLEGLNGVYVIQLAYDSVIQSKRIIITQ